MGVPWEHRDLSLAWVSYGSTVKEQIGHITRMLTITQRVDLSTFCGTCVVFNVGLV